MGGFFYPELWLKEVTDTRNKAIFRALPFYLDIITLSVESGTNLTGGLTQALQWLAEGTGQPPAQRIRPRAARHPRR